MLRATPQNPYSELTNNQVKSAVWRSSRLALTKRLSLESVISTVQDREGTMVWRKPTIEPIPLSMEITAYSLSRE